MQHYLQDILDYQMKVWWKRFHAAFGDSIGKLPKYALSKKMTRVYGTAYMFEDSSDDIIRISFNNFEKKCEEFCKVVIPHEIAHIVAWRILGDRMHGKGWQSVMIKMGLPPSSVQSF